MIMLRHTQPAGSEMLQPQLSHHAAPQVAVSVANHQQDLPDRVHAVAVLPVQDASRDALTVAWTSVVQEQGGHARSARSKTVFSFVAIPLCLASSQASHSACRGMGLQHVCGR